MFLSNHKILKRIVIGLIIFFLMWISFGVGLYFSGRSEFIRRLAVEENVYVGKLLGKYSQAPSGEISQDINFNLFWDVWDKLKEYYVDRKDLTDKKMFYGALRGLVSSAGDPYTVFMDPKVAQEFSEDLAGTFEGIGAEIGIKNDTLTIIAPLPDMPAEKAGLKAGDKVLAINGESTVGITLDEAVRKIRGPRGTTVTLSVARKDEDGIKDITITRGKIVVKSVRTNLREDNIFVIKITNFNEDTEKLFNQTVRKILDKNPRGIILDLRNNPGGLLDTAIEVASEWIEDGVVVTEKFSDDKKIEHLARGRARLKGYSTVVLVNQGSASASEIVAGALQDYGLATLVGKKTFGKGSVQTLLNLPDGSSMKITVAKWLTPKGRSINDEGIDPDVEVDLTLDDYNADKDPQMDKAVEMLLSSQSSISPTATTSAQTSTDNE
jgi:carboxyl-terminal processing protease